MKTILRLFVATVAMCSFVACGGDDVNGGGDNGGGETGTEMSNTVWSNNNPVVETVFSFGTRNWSMTTGGMTTASGTYHTCENGVVKLLPRKEAPDVIAFTGSVSGSSMTVSPGEFGTFTKK